MAEPVILERDAETGALRYRPGVDPGQAAESQTGGGVPMLDPSGQPVMVPFGDVSMARGQGFTPTTVAQQGEVRHEQELEREYGDSSVRAFAEGAGRGLSFGLTDVVLPALGASREGLRERRERNPIASTVGEVGGAVGGAFVPGLNVAGVAGRAVQEGVAGARAVRALATGGRAARALARYTPVVARNVVEGATYGVGGSVSNVALSKDPMSAEAVFAELGSGALLGGGIGGLFGAGSQFLADTAHVAKRFVRASTMPTIADDVIAGAERELAGGVPAPRAGASKRLSMDELPPSLRDLVGDAAALATRRPSTVAAGRVDDIAAAGTAAREVDDAAIGQFKTDYHKLDTASRQNIRQMEGLEKKGVQLSDEMREAAEHLEEARRATRKFLPLEPERSYESLLAGELGGSYAKGQGKSMQTWVGDDRAIVDAVRQPGFRDALLVHQEALDHMQALLGNRAYPHVIPQTHPVFGAPAPGATQLADAAAEGMAANPLARAVESPATAAAPKGKDLLGKLGEKVIGKVVKKGVAAAVGGVLGHAVGGPVGGFLGHVLLERPIRAITDKLLGRVSGTAEKLAGGVDRIVTAKAAAGTGPRRTVSGILGALSFEVAKRPRGEDAPKDPFEARAAELRRVSADPMGARRQVHASLDGVRLADPMLADQLESLTMRRLMFVAAKVPRDPRMPSFIPGYPWEPTPAEKDRFARYAEAAERPVTVLEDVADGTVTREQVEALREVYPETYRRVQMDIITQAAELQAVMPWERQVSLSAFFAPTQRLLSSEGLRGLQATYAAPAPTRPPGDVGAGSGGMSDAAAGATRAQRLASK